MQRCGEKAGGGIKRPLRKAAGTQESRDRAEERFVVIDDMNGRGSHAGGDESTAMNSTHVNSPAFSAVPLRGCRRLSSAWAH